MFDILAAIAAGVGVTAVILIAGIFAAEGRAGKNAAPVPELLAIVLLVSFLAGLGMVWVML